MGHNKNTVTCPECRTEVPKQLTDSPAPQQVLCGCGYLVRMRSLGRVVTETVRRINHFT